MSNSFYEIATKMAKKQQGVIDQFTEDAPILASMPIMPSSHGLMNVYEEVLSVDPAEQVDLDATLPTVDMESKLMQVDLAKFGAIMEAGEDVVKKFGGPAQYFGRKTPTFLRQTGMDMEYSILYNVIRAKAHAASKLTTAGGSNNANYTLLIVRWMEGENMGLYDAEGFGNGKVFDIAPVAGGTLYKFTKGTQTVIGYGQRFVTYFGTQIGNLANVSGVKNIDLDDDGSGAYKKMVTEMQLDDALDAAKAGAGTFIYCHPKLKRALGKYKSARLNVAPMDKNFNRLVDYWDDIPIISSRNFQKGTEPNL
jgi:hypothetical protein